MARSLYKGPFYKDFLLKKVSSTLKKKKPIKIWCRNSIILPEFLGYKFQIYTGNRFIMLTITENMVGYKFGEFALTRKIVIHKKKKNIRR